MDESLTDLQHVRRRPGMYIGTLNFFGLVHYFVSAVNLLLEREPSRIRVEVLEDGFRLSSDARIEIERTESGEIIPFEKFTRVKHGKGLDGPILTALSSKLSIQLKREREITVLGYDRGVRIVDTLRRDAMSEETVLEFTPDDSIFAVSHFSGYNFFSYLKRISYLYPSCAFSCSVNGEVETLHSPEGIRGLFDAVATPYQILHDPIHIHTVDGDFEMELVWGFHSWEGDVVWSFINRGRAVEGGTHDDGLAAAFDVLPDRIGMVDPAKKAKNGIIAVMSIRYPHATWEGCLKAKIGNEELTSLVRDAVIDHSIEWIDAHPPLREQLKEIQIFHFPDMWIRSR